MGADLNLLAMLFGLGDRTSAARPDDKNAIAACGCLLEQIAGRLAQVAPPLAPCARDSLSALQKVYLGQVPDGAATLAACGDVVRRLEAAIRAEQTESPELAAAVAALAASLGAASTPATPAPAPAAPPPAPPADLPTLDDIAAALMVVTGEDLDAIRQVDADVAAILKHNPDIPANGRKPLSQVSGLLGLLSKGAVAEPDALLTEIGRLIAEVQNAVEERHRAQQLGRDEADARSEQPAPAPSAAAPAPPPTASSAPAAPPATPPAASPAAASESPKPAAQPAGGFEIATPPTLPKDTDPDLLKEYIIECNDHIAKSEAALLELETNPDGKESINTVFRAFHTIKGTSGFLGLELIQRLAHLAETLLDRAREGQIRLTGGYADLSLEACDTLKAMIKALDGVAPGAELAVPPGLPGLFDRLAAPEACGITAESGAKAPRVGDILVATGAATREQVEKAAELPGDQPIGEKLVQTGAATAADVAQALRAQKRISGESTPADSTIRVGTERLDRLLNMVGELVISQSMIAQDPLVTGGQQHRLARNVSHTGKIIRELQDLSMSLRMVPLKATFQKMQRLVRDLARRSGKSVQFVTEGEDTEIDRNMVEVLNDPLVHMIRNACDHGIEAPDVRRAAGKAETGTVTLRAYQSAGSVILELKDDGKGLDREKILRKAVSSGLVDAHADLKDSEVFQLIFRPGFSTADKVTDVSGRGVGMDVVKRNIESVRGRIEISSVPGHGSRFLLRLPLTTAITDAMLLRVGKERYLLPTVSIEQSFRAEEGSCFTVTGRGEVVKLRNDLIPIVRMHRLFDVPDAVTNLKDGLFIALESGGRRCALMADELLGQQQVVIKSLGRSLENLPGIAGGAILGDGRVGLILDPAGIFNLITEGGDEAARETSQASEVTETAETEVSSASAASA